MSANDRIEKLEKENRMLKTALEYSSLRFYEDWGVSSSTFLDIRDQVEWKEWLKELKTYSNEDRAAFFYMIQKTGFFNFNTMFIYFLEICVDAGDVECAKKILEDEDFDMKEIVEWIPDNEIDRALEIQRLAKELVCA